MQGLPVPAPDGPIPPANLAGDIYILWDNSNAQGDWTLATGDVQTGQDLETACLVSLFTDKLATPDFVPTDGSSDRRGWWPIPTTSSRSARISGNSIAPRKPATRSALRAAMRPRRYNGWSMMAWLSQ